MAAIRSLRDTLRSSLPAARSRSHSDWSVRIDTSSGATGGFDDLPIDGSSTWPGLIKGAVTMKITSRTSMTSMYGTTLIWFISRRLLLFSISISSA